MADFTMPALGADMDAGTLLEWLVRPGQEIHHGDPIAVVDTDKAAIEVESFHDGVVGELLVEPGTRVAVGGAMARIVDAGATGAGVAAGAAGPGGAGAQAAGTGVAVVSGAGGPAREAVTGRGGTTADRGGTTAEQEVLASPPVRHHAAELGVDLATVTGTGPHGRVRRQDVDAVAGARSAAPAVPGARRPVSPYARRLAAELGVDLDRIESDGPVTADAVREAAARDTQPAAAPAPVAATAAAPGPAPTTSQVPPVRSERQPPAHTPGRGAIGALMSRAKREIPHYYVATTVDLAALTGWLRRTNRDRAVSDRIVPAAAILRATALAAREVPELNGFWHDGEFVPGEDVHLGVAVSVRGGALVAPAIHGAADLLLPETMSALRDLVRRARSGRLTRAEMADPTLTVTDLGDQGVEEVIGVIYAPQVALLGVGRVVERPVAVDGLVGVRPVVRLTLSGDHRATDGTVGARFLNVIDRLLQRPEEL